MYNQIVVNMGTAFQQCTNQQVKATMHRVLDIGIERFSSPFFLRPKFAAMIPSNFITPEDEAVEAPVMFGPWFIENLTSIEWRGFVMPDMSMRRRNSIGQIVFDIDLSER